MWYMHEGAGWWMVFGGLSMLVFWGGLIALIVWGITRLTGHSERQSGYEALDVIKTRYAKGEINREEFENEERFILTSR